MNIPNGARVEVIASGFEKGMKGIVLETGTKYCIVRITQAGPSHHTTKFIGQEITFPYNELKEI